MSTTSFYHSNELNCVCCHDSEIVQTDEQNGTNSHKDMIVDDISTNHTSTSTIQSLDVQSYPIQYMTLLNDQCTVVYKGRAVHSYDAATIYCKQPVLTSINTEQLFSYTECELLEYDSDAHVHALHECSRHSGSEHTNVLHNALNVGIAIRNTLNNESSKVSVGTNEYSYALQCNTQQLAKYKQETKESKDVKLITMNNGDIFGVGYNCYNGNVFFTVNGNLIPQHADCTTLSDQSLYLCVSLHGTDMRCKLNVNGPYKFDLQQYTKQQYADNMKQIKHTAVSQTTQINIVRNYLLHNGYYNTLKLFDTVYGSDNENNEYTKKLSATLQQRYMIRQAIESGDIVTAIDILNDMTPDLLIDNLNVYFALQCCKFVQYIKHDNAVAALQLMKRTVQRLQPLTSQQHQHMQHCMILLALRHDEYLESQQYLADVADFVNTAVVQHTGCDSLSNLALITKQLQTTQYVLQSTNKLQEKVTQ